MPDGTFRELKKPAKKRRRSHADNQELALPKPGVRIRNAAVLEWARSLRCCEWCKRPGPTEGHHVLSVGAGGHDTRSNIAVLCRLCHSAAHAGQRPNRDDLLELIARRTT